MEQKRAGGHWVRLPGQTHDWRVTEWEIPGEERRRHGGSNVRAESPQAQIQRDITSKSTCLHIRWPVRFIFFLPLISTVQKYYFSGKDVDLIHNRISTTSWERSISSDSAPAPRLKAGCCLRRSQAQEAGDGSSKRPRYSSIRHHLVFHVRRERHLPWAIVRSFLLSLEFVEGALGTLRLFFQ